MFVFDDGGRSKTRKGRSGDCAVRAVAIATETEYEEAYSLCKEKGFHPSRGMYREDLSKALIALGWHWQGLPAVKGSPRVKLHDLEGTCIARVSKHFVAVVKGHVYDNHDPRRLPEGRCVYGVWRKIEEDELNF